MGPDPDSQHCKGDKVIMNPKSRQKEGDVEVFYLGRPHDKLLLLPGHHLRVLVPHDAEHPLEQLLVGVVPVRVHPGVRVYNGKKLRILGNFLDFRIRLHIERYGSATQLRRSDIVLNI